MRTHHVRIRRESLETFCQQVFQSLNLSEYDARTAAAVLVAADARGIPSHGVARLMEIRERAQDRLDASECACRGSRGRTVINRDTRAWRDGRSR